ncbi:hypothetical protein [Roseovarius sp. THAF8]|uniref:hypothetical protein n=1 Tax=Roseovarius sp. THAF8 TaxID=2587846 RepID=UPI0020C75967|nr:hypothetical protein [Roseovarius sp. THAF8]
MILELAEHHGNGGGRATQGLGGVGEVAALGHGEKAAEHADLDGHRLQLSLNGRAALRLCSRKRRTGVLPSLTARAAAASMREI